MEGRWTRYDQYGTIGHTTFQLKKKKQKKNKQTNKQTNKQKNKTKKKTDTEKIYKSVSELDLKIKIEP